MLSDATHYVPPAASLWQGRADTLPFERYFQHIMLIDLNTQSLNDLEPSTVIIGFCSDEGIRRNLGRAGAKGGPDALRAQLAKLPRHQHHPLIDVGNIICDDGNLEAAQEALRLLVASIHQKGHKTWVLGGGHEVAYPHYMGLMPYHPNCGIVNFDAHFDLRPLTKPNVGTSGTPFTQIANDCKSLNAPFNYCCLGIQPLGNTASLFEQAHHLNVKYLSAEAIHTQNLSTQYAFLDDFLKNLDYIYVTLCLDVLAECYAPGVSAPSPLGLSPIQVNSLLQYLRQTGKVIGMDVAELSPPLDERQKTARLAAHMISQWD